MYSTKHAYLIIAHNNFSQLQVLINLLDDERNDIYLHIDKKSHDFSPKDIKASKSQLFFVKRMNVIWGGHSQIQCEMNLLKNAGAKHYHYYHLLSGVDLPLKTQDELHRFFNENDGKEFLAFDQAANESRDFLTRTQYFHLLRNFYGRQQGGFYDFLKFLEDKSIQIQRKLHLVRPEIIPLYKGPNWFSITDNLAQYLLANQKLIKKQFHYSLCGDEVFLHSIAMASPYRDNIAYTAMRATDWTRGNPYTYRQEDVPELLSSRFLFGRKFDENIDPVAINMITDFLRQKQS